MDSSKNFNMQMHVWLNWFYGVCQFMPHTTLMAACSVNRHPDWNVWWLCCTYPGADCGQLHRLSFMTHESRIRHHADRAQFFLRLQLFSGHHHQQLTEGWKQKLWNIHYLPTLAAYCPPFLIYYLHFNIRFQSSWRINSSEPSDKLLSGYYPVWHLQNYLIWF